VRADERIYEMMDGEPGESHGIGYMGEVINNKKLEKNE
jgi:hypothetical protein